MALPTSLTCATQTSSASELAFIAVLDVSTARFVAWPQPRRERPDPSAECNPVDDSACAAFSMRTIRERGAAVVPFYATGVADRGPRDLLVIECMCQHRGRLTVRRNATTGTAADEPDRQSCPATAISGVRWTMDGGVSIRWAQQTTARESAARTVEFCLRSFDR